MTVNELKTLLDSFPSNMEVEIVGMNPVGSGLEVYSFPIVKLETGIPIDDTGIVLPASIDPKRAKVLIYNFKTFNEMKLR